MKADSRIVTGAIIAVALIIAAVMPASAADSYFQCSTVSHGACTYNWGDPIACYVNVGESLTVTAYRSPSETECSANGQPGEYDYAIEVFETAAPSNIVMTTHDGLPGSESSASATISWNASTGADEYLVEASVNGGEFTTPFVETNCGIVSGIATSTTVSCMELSSSTDYQFRVAAVDTDYCTGGAEQYSAFATTSLWSVPDVTSPIQSNWGPATGSIFTAATQTITLTTDENADCRWSLSDDAYEAMSGTCGGDGTVEHSCVVDGLEPGSEIVYIACADLSGNSDTAETNVHLNYTVDYSPPADISTVNDGLATDIDFSSSTVELSANWSGSSDTETGIARYWLAIGTTPGATDVVDWTDVGVSTSTTQTGLNLTDGETYYTSVKAENGAGLESGVASSDGLTVDTGSDETPPAEISYVNDGLAEDIDETMSSTQLSANWAESSDPDSGIAKYWYSIGTATGATDIVSWTDNLSLTSVTQTGLVLQEGMMYYFNVKAENGVGLESEVTSSDGQIYSPGTVVEEGNWGHMGTCKKNMTFNVQEVFGTATVQIFQFTNGTYELLTLEGDVTLERGKGYFVASLDSQVILPDVGTDAMEDTYTFTFNEGWNMFANPFCHPLAWGWMNSELSCGGVVQDDLKHRIYHYKTNGEYEVIGLDKGFNLLPWMAYWIDIPENGCTLKLQTKK